MTWKEDLFRRIAEKIPEKGFTRASFARALGVDKSYVSHLLNGEKRGFGISLKALLDMADILDVPVEELLMKGPDQKYIY